ncbi:Uncharacterised protein [uncultured archaeon]|nr:Uncharacterised protein [uncultured archaeon]
MNQRKIIDGRVKLYITVIIILIALNIPYTTKETFTEKEFYTEQEPYNLTQTYYEKESYIDNVPLKINTTLDWYISDYRYKDEFDLIATLKNIDNTSGEFWVTFHVESTNGSSDFTTERIFLMPGEIYQIEHGFTGLFSYVTYKVKQPTKEVEKFRDRPEERTITSYRDIEKSREAVRVKKNTLSLLQRIFKYPPNYEPGPPLQILSNNVDDNGQE